MSCPTLFAPANGSAIVTTYMAGGVARYVCDAGFDMSHVVNLTCQSDGTWSDGDIPTCISEASGKTMSMTMPLFETSPQLTTTREKDPTPGTPLGPGKHLVRSILKGPQLFCLDVRFQAFDFGF